MNNKRCSLLFFWEICTLFQFLFKCVKNWRGKELTQRDIQSITKLFDCGDGNLTPTWIKHTVHGWRSNPWTVGKLVSRYTFLKAYFFNPLCNSVFNCHVPHPILRVSDFAQMRIRTCVISVWMIQFLSEVISVWDDGLISLIYFFSNGRIQCWCKQVQYSA